MMYLTLATLIALFVSAQAVVGPVFNAKDPNCNTHCYTSFGSKSTKHVPTHTNYHTKTVTYTTTKRARTTFTTTPTTTSVTTATVTATSTSTATTSTNSITSTSTVIDTTTITPPHVTATTTSTVTATTTTTSTSTTIVSTSAGFLPVQSTLPNSGYSGDPIPPNKRDLGGIPIPRARRRGFTHKQAKLDSNCQKPRYPAGVECEVYKTKTITKTITKTQSSTSTAPTVTSTKTATSTTTTISTLYPSVTSTITTSVTTTISVTAPVVTDTTTSTTTTTSTSTDIESGGPTVYPACSANNFASYVPTPDAGIQYASSNQGSLTTVQTTDAYSCCVACQVNPLCGVTAFELDDGTCFMFTATVCTDQTSDEVNVVSQSNTAVQQVISNGNCGQVNSYYSA